MKKALPMLVAIMVLALALAACSQAADRAADSTPGPGVEITQPAATDLGQPTEAVEEVQPTATGEAGSAGGMAADADTIYRASKLIGHEIDNANGDSLGSVDSLIVDRQSGRIHYLVVASGGALGIGDKLVAVPYSAFTANPSAEEAAQQLVLDVDQEILAKAPSFDLDALPDITANNWDVDIRNYWSSQVDVLPQTGEATTAGAGGPVRLQDVTDLDIRNAAGEDIGDIEDMLLDPSAGQIRYIVLAAGGILDVGEKLIPLPFSALTWAQADDNDQNEVMVLNVEQEQVVNAPAYASWNEFPDLTVEGWDADLAGYWGK